MKKISRNKFSGLTSHLASKAGLGGGNNNNSSTPPPPPSSSSSSSAMTHSSSSSSSGGVGGLLRRATWADKVREKLPELGEHEYEVPWERGVLGVIFLESEKGGVPYVSKATESCISPLVRAGDVLRCVNDVRSQDHSFSEFFKILATMKKPVLLRFERPASSTTSSDGEDSPLEQRSSSAVGIGGGSDRSHAPSDTTPKVLRSNSVPQGEAPPKSQRSAFWRTVSAKDPPAPAPAPAPAPSPIVTASDPRASVRTPGGNLKVQVPGPARGAENSEYAHGGGFVDTRQFEVSPRLGYHEPAAAADPDHYEYEVYWETGSLGLFFGEDRLTSLPVVTRSTPNANSVVQRTVAVNDTLVSANNVYSRNYSFEAFFARLQQMKKPVRLVFRRKIDPMSPAPGSARARVASVTVDTLPSPGEHSARRLPTPPRPMPTVGEQLNGARTPPESPAFERRSVRESRRDTASLRTRRTELDIDTGASPPVAPRSSPTPTAAVASPNGTESRRTAHSPLNLARASVAIVAPRTSPTPAEAVTRGSDSTVGRTATMTESPLDLAGASAAIVAPRASVRIPKAPASAPEPSPSSQQAALSALNLASASAAIMSTRSEPRRSGSASLSPGTSWEDASENERVLQSESPKQQKRSSSVPSPHSSAPVVQRQSSSSSPTPTSRFSQSQSPHSKRSRTPSPHSVTRQSEPALAFDEAKALSPPVPDLSSSVFAVESNNGAASTNSPRVESQHLSSPPTRSSISSGVSSPPSPSPKPVAEVDATTSSEDDSDGWIASPKAPDADVISPTAIEGQVRMSAEGLSMWEEDGVGAEEGDDYGDDEAPEDDAPVSRSSWDEPLDVESEDFDAEGKALDDEFEYLMEKMQEQAKASSGAGRVSSEGVVVGVVADVAIGVAVEGPVPGVPAPQPIVDGAAEETEIVFVAAEPLTVDPLVAEIVPLEALREGESEEERKSDLENELESTADAGLSDDSSDMLDAIEHDIIVDIDGSDLMSQEPKLKSGGGSGGASQSLSPFKANRATVQANLAKYKRRPKNSRPVTKLPWLAEDLALTVPLVAPNAVNTTVQVRGRSKPKPSMQSTPDSTTYLVKWKETRSIGLQLKEVRLAKGVFPLVTDVCQEPCCELLKHVCVGDVILEINGRNTSLMGVKKTVGFLKTCTKTTLLKLRHGPSYVPQRVSAHL